jgi:hypothetical protein
MRTKLLLIAFGIVFSVSAFAQNVGINADGSAPAASAGLDINFTNRGLLIPRVALTATNAAGPITSPANWLMVFNTATAGTAPNNVWPGPYYWNGSQWVRILANPNDAWTTRGNAGTNPTDNFIGTTDAQDFVIRTNNINKIRVRTDAAGIHRIGIGTNFPGAYPASVTPTVLHIHDAETGANDFAQIVLGSQKNTANNKIGELTFVPTTIDATDRRASSIEGFITALSGSNVSGDLRFFTNNIGVYGEKVRIQADGNVGINTTAPSARLHVVGPTTGSGMTIFAAGGGDVVLNTGGTLFFDGNYSYAGGNYIRPVAANTQAFFTSGAERMRIIPTGNVGIGTSAPVYRLDLGNGTFGFGNANQRTETRDNAGLQGNAGAQSGFFETAAPVNYPAGASSWWHLIDVRHSNTGNNYAMQFAGSFFDQNLYFRKTNNNASQAWAEILTENSGWKLTGNAGTTAGTNFIGTTDNMSFDIRTNNVIRSRLYNSGVFLYLGGPTNYDNFIIAGPNNMAPAWATVWAENPAPASNGSGYGSLTANYSLMGSIAGERSYSMGVYGQTGTGFRSAGVFGIAGNLIAWAALGYRENGGTYRGLYYTSANTGTGFMPNSSLSSVGAGGVGDFIGHWTRGGVFGSISAGELISSYNLGSVVTSGGSIEIVNFNNERTPAYSVTSTDLKVYSDGTAMLVNGRARVYFDDNFKKIITKNPSITVSPMGRSKGIYIESIDENGFTVVENEDGSSTIQFSWIAVGTRIDNRNRLQLPNEILSADFDENLKEFMFNENNTEQSAKPMWWDGNKIVFGIPAPENNIPLHQMKRLNKRSLDVIDNPK